MPDLNSIIAWIKRVRTQERKKITIALNRGYKEFELYQARADMLSDLLEVELEDWANRNTEPGELGPRIDKLKWRT